ncbi:tyrosine-type recombinase/integrase [Leucobacter manosquensis]|uniref:Tyrosine-type recombinase/integrase n=1 Tax=Leucobacter manosquensis TaxID=2810611 RepID=A0ABS5M7U9_9MICO|nr:tyrosine-type recombinase/integrase [Leucobacter manosquensis]
MRRLPRQQLHTPHDARRACQASAAPERNTDASRTHRAQRLHNPSPEQHCRGFVISEIGTFGELGYLFPGKPGEPPTRGQVGYWWAKARTAASVDGVRLHDLRHFYASGLIANGCDVVTVQQALGHAKATTTLNTYSHLWPTAEDKTRAAVGAIARTALAAAADSMRTADPEITTA